MKKILSLILALLMLTVSIPFAAVSAEENAPMTVVGPNNIDAYSLIGAAGIAFSVEEDGGKTIYHGVAQPGTYTNNSLGLTFSAIAFNIIDYPFIKINYRSDSESPVIDVSSRSSVGESWMSSHPKMNGDGQWHELIINLKDITGGAGVIPDGDATASLTLKPFNSNTVTLTSQKYFDLEYIACFKTEAEAKEFVYTGEASIGEVDLDFEYFYEEATDEIIKKYMDETDALIEEIENAPTTVEVTGTKYYVSSSTGNDNNDGLTPETAWETAAKASNFGGYKDGDGVFFKRGDEWRITSTFKAYSGVTYSAYGNGAKPKLIASIDASGSDKWMPTEYENIYAFTQTIQGANGDVGTIVFDGGRAWGIHVQPRTNGQRLDNGTVFNGLETYTVPVGEFRDQRDLKGNLEFYHNWSTETLYLYCEGGNPGDVFSSIEVVDKGNGISLQRRENSDWAEDIVIDNIEIFGAGAHGIGAGNVKNVTIQYCVLKWIGGSIQSKSIFGRDYGTRYGNAVESYGSSDNFIIRYNYASQIYDCCWTVQQQQAATMKDIQMYKNVSEYCNTGLEVWQSGGTIENMQLHDNYTRFNGYGWSHQRPNKDGNFFYGGGSATCTYINNDVYNNVGLFSSKYVLLCAATGTEQYNFHDNVYIMENNKYVGGVTSNPGIGRGAVADMAYTEQKIARASAGGFEKGTKFYYTEPNPFENMYGLCLPDNGVNAFDDVASDFWGRDAIDYVVLQGLFNGVSADEFSPNGTMTRAMLVTVLSRLADETGKGTSTYTDVNTDAWFASAVAWAEENGIVDAGGKFRPDDKATREEMADMLYRYANKLYKKTDISSAKNFTDSASVNAKYADGIKFCTVNGIIGGYSDGSIKPANSATRAEVATMIKRFMSYLATAESDTEKILNDVNTYTLSGEALKKTLDNTLVRAVVQEDGAVKFTTFTEAGRPVIRIYNTLTGDVNFSDYSAAVIEFDGELSSNYIITTLGYVNPGTAQGSQTTSIKTATAVDKNKIVLDYSEYISNMDTSAENDNLVFIMMPWGEVDVALNATDSFIIKSVTLFDNADAAKAYAG